MAAVAASGGNLIHVYDDKQFKDELEKAGSDLVVVDFFATWYDFLISFEVLIKSYVLPSIIPRKIGQPHP